MTTSEYTSIQRAFDILNLIASGISVNMGIHPEELFLKHSKNELQILLAAFITVYEQSFGDGNVLTKDYNIYIAERDDGQLSIKADPKPDAPSNKDA